MKIETRIRQTAAKKVKVKITKRRRSSEGFSIIESSGKVHLEPTRAGALTKLLALIRCSEEQTWKISVVGK